MRVIGLMSGTSLDGVDAALIETDGETVAAFGPGAERPYTEAERAALKAAVKAALVWRFSGPEPDFSAAEAVLTATHAEATARVLDAAGLTPADIDLIGFHGQTVLHRAPQAEAPGATRQIGDGAALARATGIDVIYDFRGADMAAGGQGAPLAPLYHAALARMSGIEGPLAVLNLGGVANVTWIAPGAEPSAFDTGPASGLIDAWCERTIGRPYDKDGALARAGRVNDAALAALLDHPFFEKAPPKSLDRWDFSLDPVQGLSPEDGAATLTAFSARTAAAAILSMGAPRRVLATGGGRKNPVLMAMLGEFAGAPAEPVEAAGWRGDLIEAEAFAYLAARSVRALPLSLPSTTGVPRPLTGGRRASAA
ncbi:MAG: anhydro-N-acetylmuramic acid kinase [Maricaulaceae bacterium]|nr:anhydro-N-acetylmuramic acid kinase [Maricaulaceae bacterium]